MAKSPLKILILEDAPERWEWFRSVFSDCDLTITDKASQACQEVHKGDYDLIFLDRDISHPTESGEDVAWEMKMGQLAQDAIVVIHTVNPHGQRVMKRYLDSYHPSVYQIPFTELRKMKRSDFNIT